MSVESLAIALHHSRATGTAKLVLIGIANHDGDGGAWPSIRTLSRYAGVDTRNVQRALERLQALHEIVIHQQHGGTDRTPEHLRPNLYEFRLMCPSTCDHSRNHKIRNEVVQFPLPEFSTGVATAPPGGDSATGGVATAPPEPSIEPTTTDLGSLNVLNRAREIGCGHELIDDRHCILGCQPAEVSA